MVLFPSAKPMFTLLLLSKARGPSFVAFSHFVCSFYLAPIGFGALATGFSYFNVQKGYTFLLLTMPKHKRYTSK
ncbi:hypothetical protein EDC96DRAFT_496581 [Choanephora cucurbitarum]|nr:hypothetical protein EDC96DRAFT_496581 [Choanephora cucurbitarum]